MTKRLARHPFRSPATAAFGVFVLAAAILPAFAETPGGRVLAVRFWSLGDVTRVAIETDREIHYRSNRVPNPDRIFFDLRGIKPKTGRRGIEAIPVGDKLLKQIRIAETQPGVTRVVLDLEDGVEYSASQLAVPDRLIIELRAATAAVPPLRSVTGNHPIPADTQESEPAAEAKSGPTSEARKAGGETRTADSARPTEQPAAKHPAPVQAERRSPVPGEPTSTAKPEPEREAEAKPGRRSEPRKPAGETRQVETGRPPSGQAAANQPSVVEAERRSPAPGEPESAAKKEPEREAEAKPGPRSEMRKPAGETKAGAKPAETSVPDESAVVDVAAARPARRSIARTRKDASKPDAAPAGPVANTPDPAPPRVAEDPGAAAVAQQDSRGSRSLIRALGLKIGRVVLDPGHGGHDSGTIGPGGLAEKDLVLDVAKRLGALITERLGSEVVYTRSTDVFVPLETRTEFANEKKADLFLSIHANSSRLKNISGPETFYLNLTTSSADLEVAAMENASSQRSIYELQELVQKIARKEKVQESREFASSVQTAMYGGLRGKQAMKNRGVKKAPFIVLIGAQMPSVLAEIAFLSNPREEKQLRRPEYRQRIAESLFKGLAQYANTLSHFEVARTGQL